MIGEFPIIPENKDHIYYNILTINNSSYDISFNNIELQDNIYINASTIIFTDFRIPSLFHDIPFRFGCCKGPMIGHRPFAQPNWHKPLVYFTIRLTSLLGTTMVFTMSVPTRATAFWTHSSALTISPSASRSRSAGACTVPLVLPLI